LRGRPRKWPSEAARREHEAAKRRLRNKTQLTPEAFDDVVRLTELADDLQRRLHSASLEVERLRVRARDLERHLDETSRLDRPSRQTLVETPGATPRKMNRQQRREAERVQRFVVPSLPEIDFARIRDHDGTKHRAWEDLSYVLAWDLDDLEGTLMERRGTPDGGIEFSCVPSEKGAGGRWAWQAKYLFRFDASTFKQMEASFLAAIDSTPDLERYTFVLPKDRSIAGLREWKARVAKWSKTANRKVEICFQGHSAVLKAIAQDRHAGAIRYFFDEAFLTADFFTGRVAREVANLGQWCDPGVNVETEARLIIVAACRSARSVERLTSLIGAPGERTPFIGGGETCLSSPTDSRRSTCCWRPGDRTPGRAVHRRDPHHLVQRRGHLCHPSSNRAPPGDRSHEPADDPATTQAPHNAHAAKEIASEIRASPAVRRPVHPRGGELDDHGNIGQPDLNASWTAQP
jgi:hypothetical protein